jgi:enoyl-CoA hydratase
MDNILFDEPQPGVRRITLNAPDRLNALSYDMYETLLKEFERLRFDTSVRVVILTGAGRGFCSGNFSGQGSTPPWIPEGVGKAHFPLYFMELARGIPLAMQRMPQAVIAAVNGPAAGFGFSLSIAADIAIAAKSAKFVNAIHNAGTGCEGGMSYLLPHAVGSQKAAEILFTMRAVSADEAERTGLVLKSVPDEALMDEVLSLAADIAANAPLDIWLTKQALHANRNAGSLSEAMDLENRACSITGLTEDAVERRRATFEKRAAVYNNT